MNKKLMSGIFIIFAICIYEVALSDYTVGLLYKSVEIKQTGPSVYLEKEYAFAHTLYYALLVILVIFDFSILLLSQRKKNISRKTSAILMMGYFFIVVSFLIGRLISKSVEILPLSYVIMQFFLLLASSRFPLYDIKFMSTVALMEDSEMGIVSFDFAHRYMGSDSVAQKFIPELNGLFVDSKLKNTNEIFTKINALLDDVEKSKKPAEIVITKNSDDDSKRDLKISAIYFYNGKKASGYQLKIEDISKEQEYIRLINNYNANLEKDVAQKTEHIQEIMNQFVMGMAEMVQNRDNSTGGHIKRTSQVIKILSEEMKNDDDFNRANGLDKRFYENLIKAAPMHDLGKIAVDDAILRKPGKFTDDEYNVMKEHSQKGAEILQNILGGIEDADFVQLAVNVANFHHERFDGKGYPLNLQGKNIPIEARIMAVADVYDALVSKRCYKEAFSFEKAAQIVEEGWGSQFDPALAKYFNACRSKIEEYYSE